MDGGGRVVGVFLRGVLGRLLRSKLHGKEGWISGVLPDPGCGRYRRRWFVLNDAEKVAKYHVFELEQFMEQNSAVKSTTRPLGASFSYSWRAKVVLTLDRTSRASANVGKFLLEMSRRRACST